MRNFILLISAILLSLSSSAQLQYYSPDAMEGYTLFLGNRLYLVNNCGEKVNSWNSVVPIFHVKLLPNGNIIYLDWEKNAVIERDWDDNFVKSVPLADSSIKVQYEVIVLENGNYLCVGRKELSLGELEGIGYNLDEIGTPPHTDVVVEVDSENGDIVWMWNIKDHVIQKRSPNIPNYGIVSQHPELLNVDAIATKDWVDDEAFMINGMDYNPELDQIVLSLRKMSEIVVIDHSTTTEEAAGHSGGKYGKGGDILYRWGNPKNYDRGTEDDRELYFQHNPNWIQYGEHINKIAIYNNGIYRPGVGFGDRYSNAPIIETPILEDGSYEIGIISPYEPSIPSVDYGIPGSPNHFFSNYTSATKVLPNGNVLITIGGDSRVLELQPDGTLVWDYILPGASFTFRVEKYPLDYSAFDGRDLTPSGTIENPPSSVACQLVSSKDISSNEQFKAWSNNEAIYFQSPFESDFTVEVYNVLGQRVNHINSKSEIVEVENGLFRFSTRSTNSDLIFMVLKDENSNSKMISNLFFKQ